MYESLPYKPLTLPWSWCARCQRAYVAGTRRVVQFRADAQHTHPAPLQLCPYLDCSGSADRHRWRWATIRLAHPEYPEQPAYDVVYPRIRY